MSQSLTANSPTQSRPLCPTPPLGWNSWDCFGTSVTEEEVRANADFMARHLAPHGWHYAVVDIQWSEPSPQAGGYRAGAELHMDGYGRLMPAPNRFPGSALGAGFRPLAEYVHGLGLGFGIHIMRGIPRLAVERNLPVLGTAVRAADIANTASTCPWNTDMYGVDMSKDGAQAYYDSLAALYASWEVDYLKADDMLFPFHGEEIEALSRAIRRSGRDMVLSLSPGGNLPGQFVSAGADLADFLRGRSQLWRVSSDFWDRWEDLRGQFATLAQWAPYAGPDHWPDADMLPIGRIGVRAELGPDRASRFTPDEQRTLLTLWSIARSPLMIGGDLPSSPEILPLLTNDEVLAVNQHSLGGRELFRRGDRVAWVADAPGGAERYVAAFNLSDAPDTVRVPLQDLGREGACTVRDLWAQRDLAPVTGALAFDLPPHGAALVRLGSAPA